MASVVIELQREALDRDVRVSDLLRKALVVARKLGQLELQAWIEKELAGYTKGDEIPKYREVRGDIRGWNPYRGWIPLFFEDSVEGEKFSRRNAGQAIAELEHLIKNGKSGSTLHMPFPLELQRQLSKGFGFETQVSLFTSHSSIVGIIDAVRTIVLNWALKLEEQGILGEGLSFSKQEKEAAVSTPRNINNFYGPVQSPQIQQDNQNAIQVSVQLDLESVRKVAEMIKAALPSLDLSEDQTREAKAELETIDSQVGSPKPKTGILTESLRSLRKILEGAGGGAAAQVLIELGKLLL